MKTTTEKALVGRLNNSLRCLVFVFAFLLIPSLSLAANQWVYRAYKDKSKDLIDMSHVSMETLPSGERFVEWMVDGGDEFSRHEYILNGDYTTKRWQIDFPSQNTYYVGERVGEKLLVKGKKKGKEFDKEIKIDDKPFIYNPKLGLRKFVITGQSKMECWSFYSKKLKPYEMVVKNEGIETIKLNDKLVRVVKVSWAPKGIESRFFNQRFYFRASDGVYLSQDTYYGYRMDMVEEK